MRILMVQSKYLGEVDAKLRYEIRTHFILSKKIIPLAMWLNDYNPSSLI